MYAFFKEKQHDTLISVTVEDVNQLRKLAVATINEDGKVEDVKVLLTRTDRFNSAVIALVNDSPAWKPAQKDGRPVPVVVVYPVWAFLLIM